MNHTWSLAAGALALAASMIATGLPSEDAGSGGATVASSSSGDVDTTIHEGTIGCAFGLILVPVATTDLCGKHGVTATSGLVEVPVQPGRAITGAFYELTWVSARKLQGDDLRLVLPVPKTPDHVVSTSGRLTPGGGVEGTSPLFLRIEAIDAAEPLFSSNSALPIEARPTSATLDEVLANPPLGDATGVVVGQDFRLCVHFAYEGAALPGSTECAA